MGTSVTAALPPVGFGGAPIGGLYEAVADAQAAATLECAWECGIRYFDTAPLYGYGLSEQRLGAFLAAKPRDSYLISTKVGRVLTPAGSNLHGDRGLADFRGALPNGAAFDFTETGVRSSMESSLERLGLSHVDIAYVHDPDDELERAIHETYPALRRLRDEGVVRAIGFGMNQWQALARAVEACDLDAIMLAGRYTLLDQSALSELLPLCEERGVRVVAAGVFNSGILAQRSPQPGAPYDYAPAHDSTLQRAQAIARLCVRFGISPAAASIAFTRAHPAVAGTVIGMRCADEVLENIRALEESIPNEFWHALQRERLIDARAPLPGEHTA
ncbi:MAG: aldo/keto reductase [Vulcanimicrobiaceae bacterium]